MSGRKYIESRIAEIDAAAAGLATKKRFYQQLLMKGVYPVLPESPTKVLNPKNEGKLITLRCVIDFIENGKLPPTTKHILRYLREGVKDRRNEVTVRSHLRRLRDEGHLLYNPEDKTWSLPKKR